MGLFSSKPLWPFGAEQAELASPNDGSSGSLSPQAVWLPDAASDACMLCKVPFTWINRRHHCRQCGILVCQSCSPHCAVARGFTTPVRVCVGCMGAMILAEQGALASRRTSVMEGGASGAQFHGLLLSRNSVSQPQPRSAASSRRPSTNRNAPEQLVAERHAQHREQQQQQGLTAAATEPQHVNGTAAATDESAAPVVPRPVRVHAAHGHSQSESQENAHAQSQQPASPTKRMPSLSVASNGRASADSPPLSSRSAIRRRSLSTSPAHSPVRRKSISGSPEFQPSPSHATTMSISQQSDVSAAAASVSIAASSVNGAPSTFLVESLSPMFLFNRLAGFGSLLVLDVRSAEHYKANHVPRALNLPLSEGDLLPEEAATSLQAAECTTMLAALEQRLHASDQRTFRMRQRCHIVLVGYSKEEEEESKASTPRAAESQTTEPPSCSFSLTPHLSSHHSALCLHLARLLQTEGKIASVSILDGGHAAFTRSYPFVCCSYTPLELRSGRHIHKKPFPWYPNEIVPQALYLGSKVDAANREHLQQLGITHILNCTAEVPNHFEEGAQADEAIAAEDMVEAAGEQREKSPFIYKRLTLNDEVTVPINQRFDEAFSFLDDARANQARVLVHCSEGISRSVTILIAYLMRGDDAACPSTPAMSIPALSLHAAYSWIKSQRKQAFPNLGFWKQLSKLEKELLHARLVREAREMGRREPSLDEVGAGTIDQCVDLALLTQEYLARKAAAEEKRAKEEAEAAAATAATGQAVPTIALKGVALNDARARAEEAVVEEAATPQGPIITTE